MAKISFDGMAKYHAAFASFSKEIEPALGRAVYNGAGVVADAVRDAIQGLPVVNGTAKAGQQLPGGVNEPQKEGLLNGLGIAEIRDENGFRHVKIGFDGYNFVRTKKYPNGQPNMLIARGTESGTSWKKKHPFVRPAVNAVKGQAVDEMTKVIDNICATLAQGK